MRPRRKSVTRATFASCRHPGIFIELICFELICFGYFVEPALEADDECAHGQKKYQAAGHDGEE
jgi:hypothetical protein